MKAVVLAAGYATRLYPLTLTQPKHLLQVAGKHILDYTMEQIEKVADIDYVYLVTNNKFYQNFLNWKLSIIFSKPIKIINDNTLENKSKLGAIGDLNFVIDSESINDDILVIAGDNIFEFALTDLVADFEKKQKPVLAVYNVGDLSLAKLYGIVEINHNNLITNFIEKPSQPESALASTGIYLFPKNSLNLIKQYLNKGNSPDKPGDYIAWLYKKEDVMAYSFSGKWFDIGDHAQLKKADAYFKSV